MQKKRTILFLCGWYPSRVMPTNGDFVQRHAEAVSLENTVKVVHIISDKNNQKNIEICSETINGVETWIGYVKTTKNPILKLFRFWKTFFVLLKKIDKFEVVHLHEIFPFGIFALYLKRAKKTPFIITEHWTGYEFPNSKNISKFQKYISKKTCKKAAFICPVTNDLKKSLQVFGIQGNFHRVENVVDITRFFSIENTPKKFTIVHISNMNDAHKNVSGLLKSIADFQKITTNFCLKLIGENADKFKETAKKIGVNSQNIEFINQIPHHEVATQLQKANVFVLFSNYENLPCVILEAFSCGTPVISTNVGGINEYFPADFGRLISINNQEKLTQELSNFYYQKHAIATKKTMHEYVKNHFSNPIICQKFSTLYDTALQR